MPEAATIERSERDGLVDGELDREVTGTAEAEVDDALAGSRGGEDPVHDLGAVETRALALRGVPGAEIAPVGRPRRSRRRSREPRSATRPWCRARPRAAGAPGRSARSCWLGRRTPDGRDRAPSRRRSPARPLPGGVSPTAPISARHHSVAESGSALTAECARTAYVTTGCVNATASARRSASSAGASAVISQSRSLASTTRAPADAERRSLRCGRGSAQRDEHRAVARAAPARRGEADGGRREDGQGGEDEGAHRIASGSCTGHG